MPSPKSKSTAIPPPRKRARTRPSRRAKSPGKSSKPKSAAGQGLDARAFAAGMKAFQAGHPKEFCTFPADQIVQRISWGAGWLAGKMGAATAPSLPPRIQKRDAEITQEGYRAFTHHEAYEDCPYDLVRNVELWRAGWKAAQADTGGQPSQAQLAGRLKRFTPTQARAAGYTAFLDGMGITECPYTAETLQTAWRDGWTDGKAQAPKSGEETPGIMSTRVSCMLEGVQAYLSGEARLNPHTVPQHREWWQKAYEGAHKAILPADDIKELVSHACGAKDERLALACYYFNGANAYRQGVPLSSPPPGSPMSLKRWAEGWERARMDAAGVSDHAADAMRYTAAQDSRTSGHCAHQCRTTLEDKAPDARATMHVQATVRVLDSIPPVSADEMAMVDKLSSQAQDAEREYLARVMDFRRVEFELSKAAEAMDVAKERLEAIQKNLQPLMERLIP